MFWSLWVLRIDFYVKNAANYHKIVEFLPSAIPSLSLLAVMKYMPKLDITPDQKLIKLDIKNIHDRYFWFGQKIYIYIVSCLEVKSYYLAICYSFQLLSFWTVAQTQGLDHTM